MQTINFEIGGQTLSSEISDDTYEVLVDGSSIRNRPVEFYLTQVVETYGELNEPNILKLLDEVWIL